MQQPGGVVVRSAVATAEIVGFSAVAHARADGRLPSPDELMLVSLGVFAATALLLSGRVRLGGVLATCAALQVGLHVAYATLAHPAMVGQMHATEADPAMGGMPAAAMVCAHAASAVVTALVLFAQEQALRRLASLATLRAHALPPQGGSRRLLPTPSVSAGIALIRVSPTRGPPVPSSPSTP